MPPQKVEHRIEVGDEVVVIMGRLRIPGRGVEDRGIIGSDGARILGLLCDLGEGARDLYRETAEKDLELVERAA